MRLWVTFVLVLMLAPSAFAGEYLMNEEKALGLRVVFSEPVTITAFGDVFTTVKPEMESREFVFYGGELAPWVGHWLNWEPSSAELLHSEWLFEAPGELGKDASRREVEITGQLLNPHYFAHPAYVMQGVSDRERVFAIPLEGIPELDFYPVRRGISADQVDWSIEVNDQGMVGADIEDGVLYIWASTASRTGAASVRLTGTVPSGEAAHAVIPVTVFRSDKTLTWFSGQKDYFVPWDCQLDINRCQSVRSHADTYGFDDLSLLDTTIRFSKWRPMPRLRDVEKSIFWDNELITDGFWPKAAQLRLTTAFLEEFVELGVNAIRVETPMYIEGKTGTEIYPVYNRRLVGPTMRADEFAYFVNEAHRLGMMVIVSTQLWGDPGPDRRGVIESYEFTPADRETFWNNYHELLRSETRERLMLGVDFLSVGFNLHLVDSRSGHERETDVRMCEIIEAAREIYPGPITYFGGSLWYRLGNIWNADFRFWKELDILSTGMIHTERPLTNSSNPALEDLVAEWEWRIEKYFEPFQARYNKSLIAHENGCYSAQGSLPWGSFFTFRSGLDLWSGDIAVSTRDQELHYESFLVAFQDEDWFYGPGFFWVHFVGRGWIGGINDKLMSFRQKPAEEVMARYYNPKWNPPLNRQDGSMDDWPESALLRDDPKGDAGGGDDILGFAAYQDDTHIHFAIEYSDTPAGNFMIWLDATEDGTADYFLSGDYWRSGAMVTFFRRPDLKDWSGTETLGIADTAVAGGIVELRLNKAFLPEEHLTLTAWVEAHYANWSGLDDSLEGRHAIPFIPSVEGG